LLQEELERLNAEQRQKEEIVRNRRAQKSEVEHKINELRIELGQLDVRQQDLVARVKDELQIDLAEAFASRTTGDVDWEQVKAEITELRGKIERLGNVNLDAIQEQESLEERHNFLATQVQDLTESKTQLEQLINKLNKQSRDKFVETFEQIRGNFQQVFRKLFGGGKADIVLEESDDVLEAGIEVIAKPPGKETRSISLLSGGEKSMTALALLFAVFRTKPSPFCFLDEVDAALDEANNERFNLLLRDFEIDSQFIVITHSKRTMSIADMLFGITMQQPGVSKRIAVRFDEYDHETAAA
jgi:chromosome segregation protein